MAGYIVAFISQKGGVGKSTLARGLAREAAANGLLVKIADLDTQQATSVKWNLRRQQAGIKPEIECQSFATAAAALKEAERFDLLIIDAPARISKGTLEIAEKAQLVVQPSGSSVDDLEPAILEFRGLMQEGIDPEKMVIAFNRMGTETEEANARRYVERAGFAALDGCLLERPAYREAMNFGQAVTETRYSGLRSRADALFQALVDMVTTDDQSSSTQAA